MNTFRLAFALCLLIPGGQAFAMPAKSLAEFLGSQGCAIGPSTRASAINSGYTTDAIDALVLKASADPQTLRTGKWIVLPSNICRIRPTDIPSEIRLTDPDVRSFISDIDDYASAGFHGCFLFGRTLLEVVKRTRGWNDNKALNEWLRFAAENLQLGRLAFYGSDPNRPPPGFLVLTGKCANIPEFDEIRRSQAIRDRDFDYVIRANATDVICGRGMVASPRLNEVILQRAGAENTNHWMAVEVGALGTASNPPSAGETQQFGMLRPPFCHFE